MNLTDTSLTILHVENNQLLVKLVQTAFEGFGFRGRMISAGRVDEALELLERRARINEPVHLILVDIQLADGLGLDLIREIKLDPAWQMTPVIVLADEATNGVISGAYALGANCVLPKTRKLISPIASLRTLYKCWLDEAILPRPPLQDRLQRALSRGVRFRARFADLYLHLADIFAGEDDKMGFWLERALAEGNLSNLMAFFRNRVSEKDFSPETADRLADMQVKVRKALRRAEHHLERTQVPQQADVCRWVLEFIEAVDEGVFAELLAGLFPKGPAAAIALKDRAVSQLKGLVTQIHDLTDDTELCQRAHAALDKIGIITAAGMSHNC